MRPPILHFVFIARHLPLVGRDSVPPDSYAKIYLCLFPHQQHFGGGHQQQQQKSLKRKTGIARSSQNPTYNAELVYALAPAPASVEIASMTLVVYMFNYGKEEESYIIICYFM